MFHILTADRKLIVGIGTDHRLPAVSLGLCRISTAYYLKDFKPFHNSGFAFNMLPETDKLYKVKEIKMISSKQKR